MNKFKLMLALLGAPCMVLASCGDDPAVVDKKVNSVSVSCQSKTLDVGSTVKASANVRAEGGADTTVSWSSDKESVATVDSDGLITAKGVGTAKITATSTFDQSKKGSVTITVVNYGPHPELIEMGYEYFGEWPAAKIKAFAGMDTPAFASLSGGVYYYEQSDFDEEGYAPYVEILVEDTDANYNGFCNALAGAGWHYHYDDYYGSDAFIDPSQKVEVDISEIPMDEDYSEYMLGYSVYRTADVWGAKESTTDTAWPKELADALADMGLELPFVKMGADYDFDDSDGLFIYDYSPDFNKLNGYDAVLKAAGFAERGSEEEGFYYAKTIDKYTEYIVYYGFTAYGNTIEVYDSLIEVKDFPSDAVKAYTDRHESIIELPVFAGSDKVSFTFGHFIDEEDDDAEYAQIGLYGATEAECTSYVAKLQAEGFKISTPPSSGDEEEEYEDEGIQSVYLKKGKLCVEAVMSYYRELSESEIEEYFSQDPEKMTDEEYEEFYYNYLMYMFTGTVEVLSDTMQEAWLTLSIDASAREVPGLYYNGKGLKVRPESTAQVEVEKFQLGEATLSYASDHPEIASVDVAGVVTGVAEGSAVITVSTDVDDKHYSVDVPVTVANEVTDSLTVAKLISVEKAETYTDFTGKKDASDAQYAGQCAMASVANGSGIQIRSKNSNSGIYSSVSGGKVKSITINFSSANTNSKGLKIVASNTAFTSVTDLYNATPVATITQSSGSVTYTFEADYAYFGIISANGAYYIDSIDVVWAA